MLVDERGEGQREDGEDEEKMEKKIRQQGRHGLKEQESSERAGTVAN